MIYEPLSKYYYKDRELFNQIYESRKNGGFTVLLGLDIHGHEAFYVNIPEFVTMTAQLYKKFATLEKLCLELPRVAYEAYERNCLIDEIIITNDIEGIRSTRKEIVNALDFRSDGAEKKRFEGLVKKYYLLLDSCDYEYSVQLKNSQDLRNLYDDIVIDEIEEHNLPDGELFRKDLAEVVSGTQQVKHEGVFPESKIIQHVDKTFDVLSAKEIPELYKIAIVHYMIGYIHPFYDGNGRLSRFISSYLLKREFNALIALRLAYTIKENKSDYYRAFDAANDHRNMGDLTHFIKYFIETLDKSADSLIERLSTGRDMLATFWQMLNQKFGDLNSKEQKKTKWVLWYLIQNLLFSDEKMDKQKLGDLLQVSTVTAHSYIESLIKSGAPIAVGKEAHKYVYDLDIDQLFDYLKRE